MEQGILRFFLVFLFVALTGMIPVTGGKSDVFTLALWR